MKTSCFTLVAIGLLVGATQASAFPDVPVIEQRQYKTLDYQGCYSSSNGLNKNTSYTFNTQGWCQTQCVPANYAVEGLSNGDECWCGNEIPPTDSKVDDDKCDSPCAGFGTDNCGAQGFFSVYLTGTENKAPNADSSGSSSTSSSTTSATPSVVTVGGQTMTVTAGSDASATGKSSSSSSSSGPNKAGIAAGVVVGIVAIAGIAGAGFLYWRHRKRARVAREHSEAATVNDFLGKGSPSSAGESFDSHLDPSVMASRRMSSGSLADNQDYSRRILKVTNA